MIGQNNVFRVYVPIIGHIYALLLVHGSHNHTLSHSNCRRYDATYVHGAWPNVELDSKSPFVRLINQSHRMSNNPCKLSIRHLRWYRPVHNRAVDQLFPSHGPSWESIAAVPKDQVTMTRDPQSANKQPFYCPRGSHRSNREFRIERRHMAALTWDAMFRSRRAAILADGGGGVFDSAAVWRPA